MLSDHEIAHQAKVGPIADVAADLGVDKQHLIPFGDEVSKVSLDALSQPRKLPGEGKLVLVSATTPTAASAEAAEHSKARRTARRYAQQSTLFYG